MVLYVWLIALHEWRRWLVCEKRAMPHHSRSEGYFGGFLGGGSVSLREGFRGARSLRDTCEGKKELKKHKNESFMINVKTNVELTATDK